MVTSAHRDRRPSPSAVRGGGTGSICLAVVLCLVSVTGAAAQVVRDSTQQRVESRAAATSANPFLSFLPDGVEPDLAGWRRFVADLGAMKRVTGLRGPAVLLPYAEVEAADELGRNDFDVSAEWLPRRGDASGWRIDGRLHRPPTDLDLSGDVGGSILAGLDLTAELAGGARWAAESIIGDGPFGSTGTGSGDFDAFCFDGLAGETLVVSATTPASGSPGAGLDPFLALIDSGGGLVAFEDEIVEGGFFVSNDARMEQRLPLDDRYCVFVGGSAFDALILPTDPTDAGSGPGVVSEGAYGLEIAVNPPDRSGRDLFAFSVEAGDVVGATLRQGTHHRIGLLGGDGEQLVASAFDLSGLYPTASPLPAGGEATVAYVMPHAQTVYLSVEAASAFAAGAYEVELALYRPSSAHVRRGVDEGVVHRVVLEFEGGLVDRNLFFGGVLDPDPVALSPLTSFLGSWGLGDTAHGALVERIVAVAREELDVQVARVGANGDWRTSGTAGEFAVEVVGGDGLEAQPGDVRLVIGGTTEELRLRTIGIAEAIDPGNFERTKLAVVLLDLLSGPATEANSLNRVGLAPGSSKLDLIATAIGRIAAHEAGHLFGNFHTERDLGPPTIMDSGGRLDLLLGLGEDGIYGSSDDRPVRLGPDEYSRLEPFDGIEPTLNVLSHGIPVGIGERIRVEPGRLDFGGVALGSARTLSLEIRNEGTRPQLVRPGGSEGCGLCAFGLSTTSFTLEAGDRRRVDITFAPVGLGPARLTLPVEVDGSLQPDVAFVELTGVGGEATFDALPSQPVFSEVLYPEPSTSSAQVRLLNRGEVAIRPAVRLRGPQADRFRIVGLDGRGLGQDLPPGQEATLDLVFDPDGAVGEATASLWLLDALRAAPPREVELRARSDGPDLVLGPRPYVFGALRADGASGRRSFRIENRGTRPLRVMSVELGPGTPEEFQLTEPPVPQDVAPGQTVFAPVVFAPTEAVIYRGELVVKTDDPDEPRAVVDMLGLGLLPMIEVWPTSVRLGLVPPGKTVEGIELRVANVGGASLSGTIELVDASGRWSVSPSSSDLRVFPESEITFLLSYTSPGEPVPRGTAMVDAELVIRSDDRDRPEVRIPLVVGSVLEIPLGGPLPTLAFVLLLALVAVGRLRC